MRVRPLQWSALVLPVWGAWALVIVALTFATYHLAVSGFAAAITAIDLAGFSECMSNLRQARDETGVDKLGHLNCALDNARFLDVWGVDRATLLQRFAENIGQADLQAAGSDDSASSAAGGEGGPDILHNVDSNDAAAVEMSRALAERGLQILYRAAIAFCGTCTVLVALGMLSVRVRNCLFSASSLLREAGVHTDRRSTLYTPVVRAPR